MKKYYLSVILLLSIYGFLQAQIKQVSLLTGKPDQYVKTEWNIDLISHWQNPYLQEDVALNMYIVSPSGKKLFLPCYYQSGNSDSLSLWKARFTPQEAGEYQCYFELSRAGKTVTTSKKKFFFVNPTQKKGFLHPGNDWVFRFDNGMPFRGIGENIGWESRTHDDSKYFKLLNENPKYNYGYMLPKLASCSGNFFRTWMCHWNLPIDWKNGFNNRRYDRSSDYYNPSAVKRMDWMVHLADSLGLYIMLTLGPGAYHIQDGGSVTSADDFFVNAQAKARYKNRLRYIIARWGYSTAIAAWELFNEIDNVMYRNPDHPIDPTTIVSWHDTMSAYLKQIDPYGHLVTTSISHRDLPGLNAIAHIDFNQKHIYKNTSGIPSTIIQYEKKFQKPYVIGEFAYEWDWSKNFNLFKEGMISDFKRGLWYGLFSPTPVLPMSWWWEYFDSLGTVSYIENVRAILDQMLAVGNGSFNSLQINAAPDGVQVFGVQCRETKFIYVYNPTDSIKTGKIVLADSLNKSSRVKIYDCEAGKYNLQDNMLTEGNIPGIKIELQPCRDKVFIIEEKR